MRLRRPGTLLLEVSNERAPWTTRFALIANLSDGMQIEHDGGGTRLLMRFARAA